MENETNQIFVLTAPEGQIIVESHNTSETAQVNLQDASLSSVCRTCATVTDYVIPIFSGEGLQNNLADKIHKHLPIQVSSCDSLPQAVCYQCASTLLAWHELVACCVQADAALRTRARLNAAAAAAATATTATAVVSDNGPAQNFELPPSNNVDESAATETQQHLEQQKEQPIKSETCGVAFETYRSAVAAMSAKRLARLRPEDESTKSGNENEEHVSDDTDTDDDPLATLARRKHAGLYDNFYTALVNFRNHYVDEHESKTRSYPEFTESSESETVQNEHNEEFMDADRFDDLTESNMRKDRMDDETKRELDEVQTKINGKLFFACKICGKNLSSTHTYVFHKRTHTGDKPCVCHVCGKQFTAPSGLHRHLNETHERIRRHFCSLCGKGFANAQNLKQHMRIHTGEKPFVCPHCGKRFAQGGTLHVHLKTHTEDFPFDCAECGAKFRLRSGLTRHTLKHSGERPHACYCGKQFRQRHKLNAHSLKHTCTELHSCDLCGATFGQKRSLKHHRRKMHDGAGQPEAYTPHVQY